MNIRFKLAAMAILLAGCTTNIGGLDHANLNPEQSACYAQALQSPRGTAWQPGTVGGFMFSRDHDLEREVYMACLRGKGYTVDPKTLEARKAG